ncbi:MAG: D-2-hydroxyacid dehydrogenase [Clostridia bacterium]|nr:D-2-hydroxyacid dehydrogenase [Clostridia bacterium]
MKIVVLDSFTVAQQDLSFNCLKSFGELDIYERTENALVASRIGEADIAITNKTVISREAMIACPHLKFISVLATGYNVVDTVAAKELGITVSNVPAYSTDSVAQMTFALILELAVSVGLHSDAVSNGEWVESKDFSFCVASLIELAGKTLGLIGYGNIAKAVERIAKAFGMKVIVHNRTPFAGSVSLDELLEESDIVSLHCPLNETNAKLINAGSIAKMKKGAYIINTARGGLIDEAALSDALNRGHIAGAALDVLSTEPPKADNPLLGAKNCIITPHIAWATGEARARLLGVTEKNIKGYIEGAPINVVNK